MTEKNRFFIILLALLILAGFSVSQAAENSGFEAFRKRIAGIIGREKGRMDIGFSFRHIEKGTHLSIRGEEPCPLASVFKVPLLIAVMKKIDRGEITMATPVTIKEYDKCIGSGTLKDLPAGSQVTVGKCIELMITISDNTATDILWNIAGAQPIADLMADLGLNATSVYIPNRPGYLISLGQGREFMGMKAARISRIWESKSMAEKKLSIQKVLNENRGLTVEQFARLEDASAASQKGSLYYEDAHLAAVLDNFSSPDDMTALLSRLYRGELLSKKSTSHCLYVMGNTRYNSRIPRDLPSGTKVYHKTGTICGIVNDMGIIEVSRHSHAALAVFVNNIEETRSGEASAVIGILARAVYDYSARGR